MSKVLVIGCGGVATVAIHKCCQNSKTFSEICIASRTKSKCDALKEKLEGTTKTKIQTCLFFNLFQTVDKSVSVHMELSGGFGNV